MREAMANAPVGDDVFAEDPSINALEDRVARLLGKEASLLCSSGTQSNLLGILSHCQRGEEYIVGEQYHTYKYEAGGAAVLGGVVPQTLPVEADGSLSLERLEQAVKVDDPHFPISRLIALENTHLGKVVEQDFMLQARALADKHQLQLHLDGARLFNASVATKTPLATLAEPFDSVSVCMSKGLGAPVGSLLCGDKQLIKRARRWRKMLGGGMRQAGVLAAAIDYALSHQVQRLADDHEHAQQLAGGLQKLSGIQVEAAQTNMVYVNFASEQQAKAVSTYLRERDIWVPPQRSMRLVTHLDIKAASIERILTTFAAALK
ncbi:low-specificity L-threonine aldolase [Aliidiomarina minuta]|uniref:Low-specificity L-threonine aldolase n=2 Tax=Aliidiomarina minuta TaxID=880057 RepID=A0A432WAB6_9GAMM|nr:low-specificity L-threonine aldolase [Aliidiomarina minuta]